VAPMQQTRTNTRTQMPDWRAAANRFQRATEMEFTRFASHTRPLQNGAKAHVTFKWEAFLNVSDLHGPIRRGHYLLC
ncbi:MAG: hypothetical protein VXY07_10450, partial [Planctomycetota bacterium]|nr:hypothetical protein [Planctomycetota bacterium]